MINIRTVIFVALATSAALTASGFLVFCEYKSNADMLSGVGQIISAISTSITLIWIGVAQYVQWIQIRAQNAVISLQREQMELQSRSLESTNSSTSAQIYISLINDAKRTMARYCQSVVSLSKQSSDKESVTGWGSYNIDDLVKEVAESPYISKFIETHKNDPLVAYLLKSYCDLYNEIKKYASSSNVEIRLFNITMENSSYEHVFTLFKEFIQDCI